MKLVGIIAPSRDHITGDPYHWASYPEPCDDPNWEWTQPLRATEEMEIEYTDKVMTFGTRQHQAFSNDLKQHLELDYFDIHLRFTFTKTGE